MIGWISDCPPITKAYKMIKTRLDIQQFILSLEQQFPVNDWKVDTIHLWPHLRIKLFFYLITAIEKSEVAPKKQKQKGFLEKLKDKGRTIKATISYFTWIKGLPEKENLFVGADAHRVDYRNSRFNRYFDCMIEQFNLKEQAMYLEYGYDSQRQYNPCLIHTFSTALTGFLYLNLFTTKKVVVQLDGYEKFIAYLNQNPLLKRFCQKYTPAHMSHWATQLFYPKVLFFEKVLAKIKPKRVIILCYYLEDIFALTAAANRKKIQTIEMQHGPQSTVHMAYSSWFALPAEGYDMLPKKYWCWDLNSKKVIQEWTQLHPTYTVQVVGNPWIDYWKTRDHHFSESGFILYSLQPSPLTIAQLFPKSILTFIKNNSYRWYIRLHPRQLREMEAIKMYLAKHDLLDLVNITDATQEPLPLLLSHALVHLTHFSGTAIEASLFDVQTVLLNEIGVFSFQDLISAEKAVYLDSEDSAFQSKLAQILVQNQNRTKTRLEPEAQANLFT